MSGSRSDDGSLHVLEAVFMASIMVGGVVFVVGFQRTGDVQAEAVIAQMLNKKTSEFVNIAFDWPLPPSPCNGDTKGDEWLSSVARGERSSFRDDMNRSYREGIQGNLLFENGYGEIYLHKEHDNPAIAGYTKRYEPNWTGLYVLPSLGVATGAETVEINAAAIVKSEIQMQRGDGIEILVTFADGKQKRIFASTAMLGDVWQYREFAQNLTLVSPGTTLRQMVVEVAEDGVEPEPLKQPTHVAFQVSPGPGGTSTTQSVIPAGTSLKIRFPPQWSQLTPAIETTDKWENATTGNSGSGLVATFILKEASTINETIRLSALAPTAPTIPFDTITADLSNGALAHAEFIVQYPVGPDKSLPRTLHASVPYPVRAGTSSIFGIGVANGGNATSVKQIDVMVPGGFDMRKNSGRGAELFAAGGAPEAVNGTDNGGKWSRVDGRHIRWTWGQAASLGAGKAAEFLVSVNITSDLSQATSIEGVWSPPVAAELTYENAFTTVATGWGATPGFVRTLVRPDALLTADADGYPFTELVGTQTFDYDVAASFETATQTLTGATSYTVIPGTSDLGNVQSALGNASVHVSRRIAPLGSLVTVEHDVASMITTLADQGAGGITLRTELYTPATKGCGPTRNWTRDASTLPLATMGSLAIMDDTGLGAPSVFVASEDKNAYKVGTLGTTAWSRPHDAPVTTIATGNVPLLGARVFAGTLDGNVTRLDPAFAGEPDWEKTHLDPGDARSGPAIRSLQYHEGSGRLLVQSDQAVEVRDADTGTSYGATERSAVTDKVVQAQWDEDGTILMLTTTKLQRLDSSASASTGGVDHPKFSINGAVGFSIAPVGILVARPESVTIHDPRTLAQVGDAILLPGTALLSASGDATGEGVIDLVVALDTLAVMVVSGATGTIVDAYTSTLPDLADVGSEFPPMGPLMIDDYGIPMEAFDPVVTECEMNGLINAFDADGVCLEILDPNNYAPLPTHLQANKGKVLLSFRLGMVAKTIAWDEDGNVRLEKQWDPYVMPTSMSMGAWTLGTWAYAVATSDGQLSLLRESPSVGWTAHPTAMTGKFTFTLRVPMGGFFGTNILITRIQWEDPVFGDQEVVIPEWFQVVAPDGTPVLSPWYDLSALVELQDIPMTARQIGP